MRVTVDTSGQHQLAARVDLATSSRQGAADGCNRLTGNGDVGLEHVAPGRDASAANDEIVGGFGHGNLPNLKLLAFTG